MNGLITRLRPKHVFSAFAATVLMLAVGVVPCLAADAAATVPTFGIDMSASITALITALGAVILVCIGIYLGLFVINNGLTWFSRSARRR